MSRTHAATTTEVYALAGLLRYPDLPILPGIGLVFPTMLAGHVAEAITEPGDCSARLGALEADPALGPLLEDVVDSVEVFDRVADGQAWATHLIATLYQTHGVDTIIDGFFWAGRCLRDGTRPLPAILAELRPLVRAVTGGAK